MNKCGMKINVAKTKSWGSVEEEKDRERKSSKW